MVIFSVGWRVDEASDLDPLSIRVIAATDFELAVIADPTHAWVHFDRAHSCAHQGFTDQALESMRRADDLACPLDGNRSWIHSAPAAFHL
jgi:hypothetical protein